MANVHIESPFVGVLWCNGMRWLPTARSLDQPKVEVTTKLDATWDQ
ncbi:hypothetical protein BLL52_3706 [Rhodoferax antarcticus ANT.BR]|uniref:Uncharacterized protein n=1 Tax=Rhodoferax antarcticus ANT.BR TaxID=1111071 RepID=A0A1Q8YAP2_9BURK|nr:hypothetical protein BLL52_3706 [Rhodoferax antarcticus ANT.BR]